MTPEVRALVSRFEGMAVRCPDTLAVSDGRRSLTYAELNARSNRLAHLLSARGLTHILVDLGEQRALAPRRGGEPWLVTRANAAPIRLLSGALATSEGSGCVLGAGGAVHHLFDPRTGRSAAHWKRITVHHRSAAIADALSKALYVASADEIKAMMPHLAGAIVWARDQDDREWRWMSSPVDGVVMQGTT